MDSLKVYIKFKNKSLVQWFPMWGGQALQGFEKLLPEGPSKVNGFQLEFFYLFK